MFVWFCFAKSRKWIRPKLRLSWHGLPSNIKFVFLISTYFTCLQIKVTYTAYNSVLYNQGEGHAGLLFLLLSPKSLR